MDVDEERLRVLDSAGDFAKLCRSVVGRYEGIDLGVAICDLASELIDAGFEEVEIVSAFDVAVRSIPKYSRGL